MGLKAAGRLVTSSEGSSTLLSAVRVIATSRTLSARPFSSSHRCGSPSSTPPVSSPAVESLRPHDAARDLSLSPPPLASNASSTSTVPFTSPSPPVSASSYLLSQAVLEESTTPAPSSEGRRNPPILPPELREEPWDGDEPQANLIRRVLEDSYQPLRIKGYKKAIPVPAALPSTLIFPEEDANLIPTSPAPASPPSTRPMNPWDVTFKAPQPRASTIRISIFRSGGVHSRVTPDGVAPRERLASARERSLDYSAGLDANGRTREGEGEEGEVRASAKRGRKVMGGMRSWSGIVDERIEEAIRRGDFKKNKGRGKPIPRDGAESNPLMTREEFLINRILQRQNAAPAWVELQKELDEATSTFRSEIRQAWYRRATRMLSLGGVTRTAISSISAGYRDSEWEAREKGYHSISVDALNGIMRRYNGMAPYAVRRSPLSVTTELEMCISDSANSIVKELTRRFEGRPNPDALEKKDDDGSRVVVGKEAGEGGEEKEVEESMWSAFKRAVREIRGKTT